MNWVHPTALLLGTWLLVFLQTWCDGLRAWVHVQPDLLPGLVVYSALYASLPTTAAIAILGGLGTDAWSSGPFGPGVLPLLLVGAFLHHRRDLILRESRWAQAAIGAASTLGAAGLSLGFLAVLWPLISVGASTVPHWPEIHAGLSELPGLGAGRLWQALVLGVGGAIGTPVLFGFFRWVDRTCNYQPAPLPVRRGDREIARGRS